MPFRALIDGKEIDSMNIKHDDWNALRKRVEAEKLLIQLPCCKQKGFFRTSSRGLHHFCHYKSDTTCLWEPETPQHLNAKAEILRACARNGWVATSEYSGGEWRADVFAVKGDEKIVFEVQWSSQTLEVTKSRQQRYRDSGVNCYWLFKSPSRSYINYYGQLQSSEELPIIEIKENKEKDMVVCLKKREMKVCQFIDLLLNKQIKFANAYKSSPELKIKIVFFETTCWKCLKPQHLYYVEGSFEACCGAEIEGDVPDLYSNSEVINCIKSFLKTERGSKIRLGEAQSLEIRKCYYCDALFYENYLKGEVFDGKKRADNLIFSQKLSLKCTTKDSPHWCYPKNGVFCC